MSEAIYVFLPPGKILQLMEEHGDVFRRYARCWDEEATAVVQDLMLAHAVYSVPLPPPPKHPKRKAETTKEARRRKQWAQARRYWGRKSVTASMFWVGGGRVDQYLAESGRRYGSWSSIRVVREEVARVSRERRNANYELRVARSDAPGSPLDVFYRRQITCGHADCAADPMLANACAEDREHAEG